MMFTFLRILDTGANSLCGFAKTSEAKIKDTFRIFWPPDVWKFAILYTQLTCCMCGVTAQSTLYTRLKIDGSMLQCLV